MAKTLDLAVAEETEGVLTLHRVDCPYVRKLAAEGRPVLTLFDCQNDNPLDLPKHDCLKH